MPRRIRCTKILTRPTMSLVSHHNPTAIDLDWSFWRNSFMLSFTCPFITVCLFLLFDVVGGNVTTPECVKRSMWEQEGFTVWICYRHVWCSCAFRPLFISGIIKKWSVCFSPPVACLPLHYQLSYKGKKNLAFKILPYFSCLQNSIFWWIYWNLFLKAWLMKVLSFIYSLKLFF